MIAKIATCRTLPMQKRKDTEGDEDAVKESMERFAIHLLARSRCSQEAK